MNSSPVISAFHVSCTFGDDRIPAPLVRASIDDASTRRSVSIVLSSVTTDAR
jgi:hypothetical protein